MCNMMRLLLVLWLGLSVPGFAQALNDPTAPSDAEDVTSNGDTQLSDYVVSSIVERQNSKMAVLNVDEVIHYSLLLNNRVLNAKVGFLLEERQGAFVVDEKKLALLLPHLPATPQYIVHDRHESCRLVKKWNLMMPASVLTRSWEEPYGNV